MSRTVQLVQAKDYKKYDQITHVYKCPDNYIGNVQQAERKEIIYDFETGSITIATITLPEAFDRLFLEGISNAADNVGRSRRNNVDPGVIRVEMDNQVLSITNGGIPIPVEIHEKEKIYVPELIFGTLLSSSNYEVDRHEAGKNGLGAKLINIFSKWFEVEVWDDYNQLYYKQRWEQNMTKRGEPQITHHYGNSGVKISFLLDFEYFDYKEYPEEAFQSFYRHCIDISLNSMIEVQFNKSVINYSNIIDYAKMIFGEDLGNYFIHYEWEEGVEVVTKRNGMQFPKSGYVLPKARICVIDTPANDFNISFVNSMMTKDGGDHVDAVIRTVSAPLIKMLNERNKGKRSLNLNIKDIRNHLSIILLFKARNPGWRGNSKSYYIHNKNEPPIKFHIDEKLLKSMFNWNLVNALLTTMEHKQLNQLSKTDGKKRRNIGPFNGTDCNLAGTAKSRECYLLIVEGSSASTFANSLICSLKARDYMGVFELRGKLLNVMNASGLKISENKELVNLKMVLGLVEGTDYSQDANFNKLRYGGVILLTDADEDGEHIKALIINYFFCRFKQLLECGYITWLATPIIRVIKPNRKPLKFYTLGEFRLWSKANPNYGGRASYYKGLGTSAKDDVKDISADPKYVACIYDEKAEEHIKLAFCKKLANERKKWLAEFPGESVREVPKEMEISNFINDDLFKFSIYNIKRSIPSWDGLKPSQRKILWASYKKWHWSRKSNKNYQAYRVIQFGGYVAEKTAYHHGEQNLFETIIGMAQDFIGSNNLPYFVPQGQFGSRNEGGKGHASPRYIHTCPQWWLSYVFREEDLAILDYVEDDGEKVEPLVFLPIIPMILVNGAQGIGTGWSTFIPPHNVIELIDWLKAKLTDGILAAVTPWFRNFKGKVLISDKHKSNLPNYYAEIEETGPDSWSAAAHGITEDEINNEEESTKSVSPMENGDSLDKTSTSDSSKRRIKVNRVGTSSSEKPKLSIVTLGNFNIVKPGTIEITELPIRVWTKSYDDWLERILCDKTPKKDKLLSSKKRDEQDENEVYFELKGVQGVISYKLLKLQKSFPLTNMVITDEHGIPKHYETVGEILEMFYNKRLPYYTVRKQRIITDTENEIKLLDDKVAFILAIRDKRLKIRNVAKADIMAKIDELQLNKSLYSKANLSNIDKDEIDKLLMEKDKKLEYLSDISKKDPKVLWLEDLLEFEEEYYKHYEE